MLPMFFFVFKTVFQAETIMIGCAFIPALDCDFKEKVVVVREIEI